MSACYAGPGVMGFVIALTIIGVISVIAVFAWRATR